MFSSSSCEQVELSLGSHKIFGSVSLNNIVSFNFFNNISRVWVYFFYYSLARIWICVHLSHIGIQTRLNKTRFKFEQTYFESNPNWNYFHLRYLTLKRFKKKKRTLEKLVRFLDCITSSQLSSTELRNQAKVLICSFGHRYWSLKLLLKL